MAGGYTNTLVGRRGLFNRCKYWNREYAKDDFDEYVYSSKPNGYFYAEEIGSNELKKLVVNNIFQFDDNLITIRTRGRIHLKAGDKVEYYGELWIVSSVQDRFIKKNTQYMQKPMREYFIQIKR